MKKLRIFTKPFLLPSARTLAVCLSEELKYFPVITLNPDRIETPFYIRWGNSSHLNHKSSVVDTEDFIRSMSNKHRAATALHNAGVNCVTFSNEIPTEFPVVIRETLEGFGGSGIVVARSLEEWNISNGARYKWSQWRNFSIEVGIHIVDGELKRVFKKVPPDGQSDLEEFQIRNSGRGYKFSLISESRLQEKYKKLIEFTESLKEKLYIPHGRLDAGWDYDKKEWVVIEVNSAPGLANNPSTAEIYSNFFIQKIQEMR